MSSVEVSTNFTFSLVTPSIYIFKTSSFISSICLSINNLFAFSKTSFVQHHVNEKYLNCEAILDGIRIGFPVTQNKFIPANRIKKNCNNLTITIDYWEIRDNCKLLYFHGCSIVLIQIAPYESVKSVLLVFLLKDYLKKKNFVKYSLKR